MPAGAGWVRPAPCYSSPHPGGLEDAMKLPARITLCEVGTWDGFQIEPDFIPTEQKVEVVNLLSEAGVAQLGDDLGMDEGGHLDPGDPGLRQKVHHLDLLLGRNEVGLDLEPVPGSHFTKRDTRGQFHGILQTSGVWRTVARRRANPSRAGRHPRERRP